MRKTKWVPVKQVMRTNVAFVDGRVSVQDALRKMKSERVTSLIVEKRFDTDEYGMLLFSDIAKQVIAENRAPARVQVFEIMEKPVISVRPDMDIRYCARLFGRYGISHAPVVENDEVIGIVSYYLLVLEGLVDLD